MKITQENADRLKELVQEMIERLDEFKQIARQSMSNSEYQQFKYRTLGHLEPGLSEESEWVTRYSSIDSLESVAKTAGDSVESQTCKQCDSPLDEEGFCTHESCPYADLEQDEELKEQQRRDEKHGLFGEHEDVAN